jgi:hypothetical protein
MLPVVARVETNAAIHVAAFRGALRSFLRESELAEGERRLAAAFGLVGGLR